MRSVFIIAALVIGSLALPTCTDPVPAKYTGTTTVFAWGVNWHGQISSPKDIEPRPYPLIVGSAKMNVSKITGGFMHNAVLDSRSNTAWLAGLADSGQLASGPTVLTKQTQYLPIPFIVDINEPEIFNRSVFDLAAGYQFTCIITQKYGVVARQGAVYCAGVNDKGQLGRSDTSKVTYLLAATSTSADFTSASFASIAAGPDHILGLTTTGEVWAWGANSYGELGIGTTVNSSTPVKVPGAVGITKIGCGMHYCAALSSNGTLIGWGLNDQKQLGNGSTATFVTTPVSIASGVTDFSCGGSHMLALISNRLYSWGAGTLGATGHPKNIPALILDKWNIPAPTLVADFANVNIKSFAAGAKHSIVLDTCGNVYTMGSDTFGQLGQETLTGRKDLFRSLVAKSNANIARRVVKPVAVYASWFNNFVVTEETTL